MFSVIFFNYPFCDFKNVIDGENSGFGNGSLLQIVEFSNDVGDERFEVVEEGGSEFDIVVGHVCEVSGEQMGEVEGVMMQ